MCEELLAKYRWNLEKGWNNNDLSTFDEVFAENAVVHLPPLGKTVGPEEFRHVAANDLHAMPDLQWAIEEEHAIGNTTVHRLTLRGTQTGYLRGLRLPPTGKQIATPACSVARWDNGKIVEMWTYVDYLGMLQQLGVLPAPSRVAS